MERMIAGFKRIAGGMDSAAGQPRWGIVQSVDPTRPAVRVLMMPEGVLSGWLPVVQPSAGTSASGGVIPQPGWMAFVLPDLGDAENGVVIGFAHNDSATLPKVANTPGTAGTQSATTAAFVAGEWFIVAFGSVIRLCADGSILLRPGGGTVKIDGHLTVNGNIVAQGDITDQAGTHGTLGAFRVAYDAHKHPGVVAGGASTGTTDTPI